MNWLTAHTQNYYREEGSVCNISDENTRLLVNCCGVSVIEKPFRAFNDQGRHDYYLMMLLHGSLDAQSGDRAFRLTPGDVVIYPPNRAYGYQMTSPVPMVYLWIHFTGSAAAQLLDACALTPAVVHPLSATEDAESDFEAIHRLFITRPAFFEQEAAVRLELLLTHLARARLTPDSASPIDRLQTSLRHLNRHYAQELHLEELAAMEFLSPSRYSALFRRATGLSPQQYLIRLRLNNASELLTSTDLSIAEIARSVGYEDALYFSRLFHRHMGKTPSAVRRGQMP